jgi:hypothetical protein
LLTPADRLSAANPVIRSAKSDKAFCVYCIAAAPAQRLNQSLVFQKDPAQ